MQSVINIFSCGSSHNDNIINIINHDIGEKVYKDILKELSSDRYVDDDFKDLAKTLNVFNYFCDNLVLKHEEDIRTAHVKRRRHGSKTQDYISASGIPIHKIFERWAMQYPELVAKKTLYIAFCEIPNMRHMTKLLNVDYDKVIHVEQAASNNPTVTKQYIGQLPFIHLNLRHDRYSAEKLLEDKTEGTYLVRPSQNRPSDYSVSLKLKDKMAHIRIEALTTQMGTKYGKFEGRRYTGSPEEEESNLFTTVADLINHYMTNDIFGGQKLTNIIMPPQTEKEDLDLSLKSPPKMTMHFDPERPKEPLQPLKRDLQCIDYVTPFTQNLTPPLHEPLHLGEELVGVLGEQANTEYLQKLINLKANDQQFLPTVRMIEKATCLIEYDGENGDWRGTGFLATIENFPGIILFSAGHNFAENGKIIKDFENVSLSFNNPEGIRTTKHKNTQRGEENIIREPLPKFMNTKSTMIITIHGQQLIIKDKKSTNKTVNEHKDYFALVLEDPNDKTRFRDAMGLDFLPCATKDSLDSKIGEPLACFGHPFIQKKDGKDKENKGRHELYPMRFSHGNEKKLEDNGLFTDDYKKQRFFYDLDTQGGSSGCEVIGRKYSVKGIHVGQISGHPLNAAQPIKNVLQDLQQLGLLNPQSEKTKHKTVSMKS